MIPRERVKNERPHEVPLSDAAIAVIKTGNRIKSRDDFVFTTTGVSAVSGFGRAKRRLDEKIKELKGKPLEHWTFHDLRVHSGNRIGETTLSIAVTEAALNHISGSKGGIVGFTRGISTRAKSARPRISGPDTSRNLSATGPPGR
jgi:integrase